MSLAVGSIAPDFSLVSMGSKGPEIVKLSEQCVEGRVLLLFVPMAFTGVCTEEFCALSNELDSYEGLGVKVLGISGDSPFAQQEWKEKEAIKLTLLSDYEHDVAKAFDVAYEQFLPEKNLIMGGVPKRSAFVIGQDLRVLYAESSDDPRQLPNFEAIKAMLAE